MIKRLPLVNVAVLSVALLALVGFTFVGSAASEEDAAIARISTPVYRPDYAHFSPLLGTYNYTVSWQGIPAADASIKVSYDSGRLRVVVSAKTYSGIDLLYKLRYRGEGLMSVSDLLPIRTLIDEQENSKIRNTQIVFHDDGKVDTVRTTVGKPAKVSSFNKENFTLDPFSAAFLARSVPWELGETKEFDTFNGKSRYLISLTAIDKTVIDVNGTDREVWVISPKVRNLNDPEQSKKLREAKIYLTADNNRDIVKIVSSVFIGSVRTTLDSFIPDEQRTLPLQLAERRGKKAAS